MKDDPRYGKRSQQSPRNSRKHSDHRVQISSDIFRSKSSDAMEVPPCLRCERLAEGLPKPLQESADGTSGVSADGMMGDVWVNFTRCFFFFFFTKVYPRLAIILISINELPMKL